MWKKRTKKRTADVAKAAESPSLLWLGMIFYSSRLRDIRRERKERVESKRLRVNER